ncbi:MAG: hypothetical protein COZ32_02285, partial [Nitrospirae bacterium CG_4_10_14_3_um_filter_53_41]
DSVNAETECHRLNKLISQYVVDLTFIGIGVNGHIAFNDPPADLLTKDPYIVVELDDLNKKNQFKKGYFPSVDNVPQKAITMPNNFCKQYSQFHLDP